MLVEARHAEIRVLQLAFQAVVSRQNASQSGLRGVVHPSTHVVQVEYGDVIAAVVADDVHMTAA